MLPVVLILAAVSLQVAGHGYLSSPPPRGIEKVGYQIDDLKSPNRKGLCRGEPQGQITSVQAGQQLKLGLTITAPHKGPCRVTLLDADLTNESAPFASKMNCAAPGNPGFWEITLPTGVSGHKVLRWYWEGQHVSPGEPYEQCIDLNFGGGGGGGAAKPTKDETTPVRTKLALPSRPAPAISHPKSYDNDKPKKAKKPKKKNKKGKKGKKHNKGSKYGKKKGSKKGGKCHNGAYKCVDASKFAVCNWGKWVTQACGMGTTCQSTGKNVVACGYAK